MKTQGNLWVEENDLIQSSFYWLVFWVLFVFVSIMVKSMKSWVRLPGFTYYETLSKLLNFSVFYFLINETISYLFSQSHKVIVVRSKRSDTCKILRIVVFKVCTPEQQQQVHPGPKPKPTDSETLVGGAQQSVSHAVFQVILLQLRFKHYCLAPNQCSAVSVMGITMIILWCFGS